MKTKTGIVTKVEYTTVMAEALTQIRKGAFLTVQAKDKLNVMTIGWASLGLMWARPSLTIMVRSSRYTYDIIEQASEFTVSVPTEDMAKALQVCGVKSGRSVDKFKESGLEIFPGIKTHTPIINCAGIHFECGIVYKTALDPKNLVEKYTHLYPDKDYHTLYFGEIAETYRTLSRQ